MPLKLLFYFLKKMTHKTRIEAIPFKRIPLKSPGVFPVNYFAFELLKRTLFKRHPKTLDGHWKIVKKKWNEINFDF